MNNSLAALKTFLRSNRYVLAAFFFALIVRSIPEILSWPYPIGVDSPNIVPLIRDGWAFSNGPIAFFQRTSMFYVLAALLFWLVQNAVIVVKILGPLLLGGLSVMMFLYAGKGLSWGPRKSLLVSVLVSTYFVSLRNSWDLYRQMLGIIFLMAALISLKSFASPRKYYMLAIFTILTVLSHELASVIMFFILGIQAITYLAKNSKRDFAYLVGSISIPIALFFFSEILFPKSYNNHSCSLYWTGTFRLSRIPHW